MRQGIVIYDATVRGFWAARRPWQGRISAKWRPGFRQNGGKAFAAMIEQEQSQIDDSALVKALITPVQHAGRVIMDSIKPTHLPRPRPMAAPSPRPIKLPKRSYLPKLPLWHRQSRSFPKKMPLAITLWQAENFFLLIHLMARRNLLSRAVTVPLL